MIVTGRRTLSLPQQGGVVSCETVEDVTERNVEGAGSGETTGLEFSECVGEPSPCGEAAVEVLPHGLPWSSTLNSKLVDVVKGVELEVRCGGTAFDSYSGTLQPAVGRSTLEFTPGTGELLDSSGRRAIVTGSDAMAGPVGDEQVSAMAHAGGWITGKVTSAAGGAPVGGVLVTVYEAGEALATATTGVNGEYTVSGVAEGSYQVGFSAGISGGNYAAQYYSAKSNRAEAQAVTVETLHTTSGINAAMQTGAQISGTVTSAASKEPLEGARVIAYNAGGEEAGLASTQANGEYTISGLSSGSYKVEFRAAINDIEGYVTQYYNDEEPLAEAEAVSVEAGQSKPGINAALSAPPAPTVTSVKPDAGPQGGGTSVTISGSGFASTTAVRFGSTAATSLTVDSATEITATSPAGTGTVDVTVEKRRARAKSAPPTTSATSLRRNTGDASRSHPKK